MGADRGFQMKNAGNTLNIIADKIISYTGDGFINAQDETKTGNSIVNIGTAKQKVGYFEAHTTFGKDDYGVAILQANEGNTVNLYADKVLLDGSTNPQGGVIGTGSYGTVNVDAKDLEIDGNICGTYGTVDYPGKTAYLNITTDKLTMTGNVNIGSLAEGWSNFSRNTEVTIKANQSAVINGDINVNGNISKYEDDKNNKSELTIEFNGDSKITGDINVKGSDADKDTQKVIVNLGGTGNMTASKGVYNVDNNANVNFTGGQWVINEWNTAEGKDAGNAAVKSGASVDVNGASMKVGNLETAGTLNLKSKDGKAADISAKTLKGANGTVTTDSLENKIHAEASEATGLTVKGNGDIADQIAADASKAKVLANVVTSGNGDAAKSAASGIEADAGVISGGFRAAVNADGGIEKLTEFVNTSNQAVSSMANLSLMTWRQENNDMNKRLGEVRASEGNQGIWARMARGQSKYGAQGIKNQYNYYQLGYDSKISDDWILGGAFTYTDGDSSYTNGSGTNKHTGFAVYGSNLRDDGSFIDLIAKYAHMKNDFDVNGGVGSGDYSTNGLSFSAEYGKRFHQEGYWIEPQAELTYGRVSSADFTTKNGASVHQDSMDSLVGRLGFSLGKDIKQGNVYVRASYLYDFQGDTSVTMSKGGAATTFKTDLGGGWWEFGVGTNLDLGHDTHFYLDVETTAGGDVDTPWQWNAGVRYSF
ncbi:MAG: autotransporter outer membrane beta-barrel domain-containing protein [Dialister sp.]|nr:autotransporter outer membrane beta-barrel domain-containing protein [Dialister sp.]MDY5545160.1 autotransporter outer membrane beta-barrel domain-containing protein [Dialister sp.]